MELKNRGFQYGKVALAVRTQYKYHQLQLVLKMVANYIDTCMSLVQTVHSLLLSDFLSLFLEHSVYIKMLSYLSGVTLIFGMSPYLNILGISLEKRYCTENTN